MFSQKNTYLSVHHLMFFILFIFLPLKAASCKNDSMTLLGPRSEFINQLSELRVCRVVELRAQSGAPTIPTCYFCFPLFQPWSQAIPLGCLMP